MKLEILILAALFAVPFGFMFLKRWRILILAVMVLIIYEGALRKWFFPSAQSYIYLMKDILLVIAYVGFLLNPPKIKISISTAKTIKTLMIITSLYFAMLVFNPQSPSFLLSLLGLKNYILYFPIAFLVPYCFVSVDEFKRLLKVFMILAIPALLISFVQFALPPTHILNSNIQQVEGAEFMASQFGSGIDRTRTSSTFSYLSGNVTFTMFMMTLSLCLLASNNFKIKGDILSFFIFIMATGAMFTTGSRTGLLALVLIITTVITFSALKRYISLSVFIRFLTAAIICSVTIYLLAGDAINGLLLRATSVTDTSARFMSPINQTYLALTTSPLAGTGLASTHNGMIGFILGPNQPRYWLNGVYLELESARVLQETGLLGFLIYFSLRFAIVIYAIKCVFRFKNKFNSMIALAFSIWFAFHLILYVATNPTAALFYYFGLGVLFLASHIERQEAWGRNRSPLFAHQKTTKRELSL